MNPCWCLKPTTGSSVGEEGEVWRSGARELFSGQRAEHAELVPGRVGHDDPADVGFLPDVSAPGTESLKPRDLSGLILRAQVEVEPVLGGLVLLDSSRFTTRKEPIRCAPCAEPGNARRGSAGVRRGPGLADHQQSRQWPWTSRFCRRAPRVLGCR
jgi:hypothetical protein